MSGSQCEAGGARTAHGVAVCRSSVRRARGWVDGEVCVASIVFNKNYSHHV